MQLWIQSDWHWKHRNLYAFTYTDAAGIERRVRERFATMEEGDAYIEQMWRDHIKPSDHVYALGDLTMFRSKHMIHEFTKLFRSLPGHKRLILGNHDHYDIKVYVEAGFQKIKASNVIGDLLLTHYPVHPSSIPRWALGNVHGHTHQAEDEGPRYLNISVERTAYQPIPIEEARRRLRDKQAVTADVAGCRPASPTDVSNNPITRP